jgi:serine/threonine-protein kinase
LERSTAGSRAPCPTQPHSSNAFTSALASRYRIERELGHGGMATVYLAEDLKHHRKVAVKALRPDLAATLGPERFLREIEIAAQLQPPNILPLLDSGEADDFLYYVMPYVEGHSLRDKVAKEGELPIGEAVGILRDVVDALTTAHERGVVHRDIKPENILLSGRHALVTDFGVAKAVSEATGRAQLNRGSLTSAFETAPTRPPPVGNSKDCNNSCNNTHGRPRALTRVNR